MLVDRFARDEQVHDFGGALENQIDAEVAHDALDGHRRLTARAQRVGGFVPAATADLHGVVDDAPAGFGVVELGDRRLEADVVPTALGHRPAQLGDRFHREGVRGHGAELLRDRIVLADRPAPLHALGGPAARDLETALPRGDRRDRQREPAGVQRNERELQPFALAPQHVFLGHTDVGEADHAVVERLQTHEMAAIHDFDAGPVHLDDERGDLLLLFAPDHLRRRARHHDQQLSLGAVGAPQFFAVQDPGITVVARDGARLHRRWIGPDAVFGQGECGDRTFGETGEILFLLRLVAEHFERLGNADRLMRGEQCGQRAIDRRNELDRLHVRELRQAEPPVLAGNLDAEGAELPQALNHVLGDFAFPIDAVGVDVLAQEPLELVEERLGAGDFVRILFGVGMDQIHPQVAEEELADETRRRPLLLACRFRDFTRLLGADRAFRLCEGSHAS